MRNPFGLDCCDFSETSAMMMEGLVRFFSEDLDFTAFVFLILAGVSLVIASGFQLYTKIRPRFPVRVNCWFCNSDSKVHFKSRNSWTCPKCEQYNGFTQSGDYNKPIPEQTYEGLNRIVQSVKWEPYSPSQNGLCRKCNINQELKVQQLASFVPIVKANFDEEIELYRQRLETAYRLCAECETKLSYKLNSLSAWVGHLYPPKVDAKIDKQTARHASIILMSLVTRILSTAAAIVASFLAAIESNKIIPLWTSPSFLELFASYVSNLGLIVSACNIGLTLLAAALSHPKLPTSDLATSFLWFLTAVLDQVSAKVVKNRAKRFIIAHIAVTVVASLATMLVHIRCLFAKPMKDTEVVKPPVKLQESVERHPEAADWNLAEPEWTGRMKLVSKGNDCTIKLEDKNSGELFAKCPIEQYPGIAIEAVADSSRYFVLRIQDDNGRSAFIGIGFTDRSDSFDLNVALQDHFKRLQNDQEIEKEKEAPKQQLDLSFKEGQTIKINMKITKKDGSEATGGRPKPKAGAAGGLGFLPPPPGGVKVPAPPKLTPTSSPSHQPKGSSDSAPQAENWGEFASANEQSAPAASPSGNQSSWVQF